MATPNPAPLAPVPPPVSVILDDEPELSDEEMDEFISKLDAEDYYNSHRDEFYW